MPMRRRPCDAHSRTDGGDRRDGHGGGRRGEPASATEIRPAGSSAAGAAPEAAPPEAAPPNSDDLINKLKELANLKDQGILTEAEFADQKAKILAEMS